MIPKIEFKVIDKKKYTEHNKWVYNEEDLGIRNALLHYIPEFKEINGSDEEIENLSNKIYEEKYDECKDVISKFDSYWKDKNDAFINNMLDYLNVSWKSNEKVIDADIGLVTIFPRYLEERSFTISPYIGESPEQQKDAVIDTCAHEVTHFIWFDKFSEIYPEIPKEEYDYPGQAWEYSEMVIDTLLNREDVRKILGVSCKSYDYFYDYEYNGENVMKHIDSIYKKEMPIEEKIKEGFEYFKEVKSNSNNNKTI